MQPTLKTNTAKATVENHRIIRELAVSRKRRHSFIPMPRRNYPLSSWYVHPPYRRRRGCPTAVEQSSGTLMCPWSFVNAGYLLLQSHCSSLGARRGEQAAMKLAMKHCWLSEGAFSVKTHPLFFYTMPHKTEKNSRSKEKHHGRSI